MKARTKMKTLLLLGVLLFGFTVSAQSQKVSLDFKNERVEKVLASIKSQTGMSLVFSDQLVDVNRKVTMQLKDVTLKEALTRLLSGINLTFEIRNNKIYFIEKKAVSQPGSRKKRVTGVVKDVMGEPLIGANVVEKGRSTNGVITDFNGKFTLEVDESASLVVSYIGYLAQDIPTKGKGDFHIILKEDTNTLDEVVVTGYGDFKKATYTGSASVLTTEKLEALPVVSVGQMIESNIPGISVVAGTSSQPGAKTTLRVRGVASMNASTEPLYVLDGVPIPSYDLSNFTSMSEAGGMGFIETLNPADIESITVLKDAASASLYGAKGANGVVLITTKKGKEGKLRVNMAAKYGITDFAYTYRPLMGGEERRKLIHEGLVNFQLDKGVSEQEAQQYADANIDQYAKRLPQGYSDWESALFKTGYQQDYNLSASAGNQNSSFIGSLGYTKQTGVFLNSEMERFTGRVDASNKYKKVEFGMNASLSWTKNVHLPEGKFYGSAIYASKVNLTPSTPIYNEDGTYASGYRENNGYNPILEAEVNDYYARTVRAMGTAKIAYNVWDNLKVSSVFTVDYSLTKDFFFQSPDGRDGATYQGRGRMQMTDRIRYTSQNNLTYSKTFGKHSVSAVTAFEVMKYDYEDLYAAKKTYGQDINTSLGNAADPIDADQKLQEDALMSYVASVNYSYDDKYYASFSFRRDGSSRLSPDTRWGNFWSLSASWRLSQERFMQPLKSVLSDLKLRASYGVNGNLPSSYYGYQSTYTTGAFYSGKPSPWESTLGNEELTWEKNYALNLGLDIGLFSRVNVSLDWYTRTTKDLLMSKQLNSISGFSSLLTNVGQMRNTGVELEVRSNNIKTKDFSWTTAFNLSHNKNKILKLADLPWFVDGRYVRKEGYPFNTIYLREYAGVDPETGSALYYDNQQDENGNYTKNKVTDPGQASPIPLKDITPTISGGFMNTFNYKFIDLSFNLSYSFGGYSYDNASYILQDDGYSVISNKSTEQRRRWQKPGDITDVPRFVYGNKKGGNYNSSRAIHSTDHIRLKSLILGLNAPKAWLQKLGIGNARIYFSGTNLLTWAAYDQYDPEMSGVVGFYTPPLKTYAFGLELKF
ncbi:TonB-dependent receptor [Phocaeicola vulgatus]|uniref:TonB-dependent receptor n=1 Tax=Phocaeicola vulgatus TaxID=821 RepID=UPI001C38B17E|nr:TonB-dependent receptor [Phocaeicola vulgatus]MBV3764910.1 TonB-dependent receptor [Phocaeicola vulgatus]MBV3769276.1 TonB-dependent receptor [Phocaeicola vulgatus]MBV3778650.1 TonB-dependent receptor [Phocaeicola vulgatus]MBV3787667.1 TonB-dependent receptor [Phocaeicola vulgatus]MBV3791840.1 TonB-dependent receptor [Phocaeicola vulgatus]